MLHLDHIRRALARNLPETSACDGDGICESGEDCNSCATDCAGQTGGKPTNRFCCGNDVVETAEGNGDICDGNY